MSSGTYYNTLYRIWSVMAFGAGTRRLSELSSQFECAEDMYTVLTCDDERGKDFPSELITAARDIPLSAAEKIIDRCETKNISIVTIDDELYPNRLRSIYSPPSVLFYKGDISGMNDRLSLGVVGTRTPAEYSLKVTSGIVKVLAAQEFDIISGFAEGIDICAMLAAIKNGSRAYGILGAGLEHDYPASNAQYRDIIYENGALISEYLPASKPMSHNFLHRNRILTGLSLGLAVIEAGERSGSLNSASHAVDQGKTVFAVPPCDLFDRRYYGNVKLIREGAVPLMGARDIYNEYCSELSHTIDEPQKDKSAVHNPIADENSAVMARLEELKVISERAALADKQNSNEKSSRTRHTGNPSSRSAAKHDKSEQAGTEQPLPKKLDEAQLEAADNDIQKNILRCLNGSILRADELVEQLGEDIGEILTALTELEIYGLIIAENGAYRIE